MARRQLVTIGDLTAARPLGRTRQRRQAMIGLVDGPYGMGSAVPTGEGTPLEDASATLLASFDATGALPEGTVDPRVLTWQQSWNADAANAGDQLVEDGKYGPLTYGAFNVMVGGMAPAVNGGATPALPATPGTTPATTTTTTSHLGLWLLLAAAAAGAYLLFRKKGRRSGPRRAKAATSIEIKSNPRRRMGGGRRRNAELIP